MKYFALVILTFLFSLFATVTVIYPNGGESFERGTQMEIQWSDNITEDVKIELFDNAVFHSDIVSATESDSSFVWDIPIDIFSTNFKVKISSVIMPALHTDISDGDFTILEGTITISKPSLGNTLDMYDPYNIEWTDDIPEDVIISLYKNTTLISSFNTTSNGYRNWNFYTSDIVAGTDYNLKIESSLYSSVFDETGFFTIKGTNNVSGSVSGIWTEPNSPYILSDSTYIESANSLTLDPGAKVKSSKINVNFDIFGQINSNGEPNEEVNLQGVIMNFYNSSSIDSSKFKYSVFDKNGDFNIFKDNKVFGGTGIDIGYCVKQTTDGGYIIAGNRMLLKTDSLGNEEWRNSTAGGRSVQQTTDGGYIVAGSSYIKKIDNNGNLEWNGDTSQGYLYSVHQTTDGGYIASGYYSVDDGQKEEIRKDTFLEKTDSTGTYEWHQIYDLNIFNDKETGYSVQQTITGGYIIVGYETLVTNSAGLKISSIALSPPGRSIQPTNNYGFVVAGISALKILHYPDYNESIISFPAYSLFSAQQTPDSGYIVTGSLENDLVLIKLNSNFDEEWMKTLGGSFDDIGYSVDQTIDGGYIITGQTCSYGDEEGDLWLIKTDSYGNNVSYQTISVNDGSKVVIQNCIIENNLDYGLIINNSSPVIANCLIKNNKGGLKLTGSSPQYFVNNTIANNDSIGLFLDGNSNPQIINNIIYGNGTDEVYLNDEGSDPSFFYNNIEGGDAAFGLNSGVTYTGSYISNLDIDPLYNPLPYTLQELSPCKDTGYPGLTEELLSTLYIPLTDLAGNARLDGEIDMGAYEYYSIVYTLDSPDNVAISYLENTLTINWSLVTGANSYSVYSSNKPYSGFELIATVSSDTWNMTIGTETKQFYCVVASTESAKENIDIEPVAKKIKIKKIENMLR